MASATISLSSDVTKLTDRELIKTYCYACELHDHFAGGDAPQPECLTVLWDELRSRGYESPVLVDLKGLL